MQTYRIIGVKETSFDPDAYGNRYWSIDFEGIQGSLLWKTKARPENGQSVFGHIEDSKSGKSKIFKKDQKPEDYVEKPAGPSYAEKLAEAPVQPELLPVQESLTLSAIEELKQHLDERFDALSDEVADLKLNGPAEPLDAPE